MDDKEFEKDNRHLSNLENQIKQAKLLVDGLQRYYNEEMKRFNRKWFNYE